MTRRHHLRLPLTAAAAAAIALAVAGPASAHVHTSPSAVQAGTENTVGFAVEHGCEGSPTTKMEIQLPEGSSGIAGVDSVDGFTSSVDGQVVTFTGGEVADGTEASFEVTFTAPDEPGDVPVKIIQTCAEGVNEWIEVQAEGAAEPESPAPVLTITEGAPPADGGEHGHDEGTDSTEAEHGHDEGSTDTTEAGDHHAEEATTTTVAVAPVSEAAGDEEGDDSSSTPLIIGGIAAVVVLGGGGALYARSRSGRTDA